jgi:probable rRNA maturation factor
MSSAEEGLVAFHRTPAGLGRRELRELARKLFREVAGNRAFYCRITDDRELRDLNLRFRGKDTSTDVLSFPCASERDSYLGDIAISWERAREQAARLGHRIEQEIQILMLHGVLHLMGMDHETDNGRMARVEARWRSRLGMPESLLERAGR